VFWPTHEAVLASIESRAFDQVLLPARFLGNVSGESGASRFAAATQLAIFPVPTLST
jgi:hypothetical protein